MNNNKLQLIFLLIIIIILISLSFFVLQPFLATLALAIILAILLEPLHKRIMTVTKNKETLSTLITILISIVCIIIPIIIVGVQIFNQSTQLYKHLIEGSGNQNIIITTISKISILSERLIPGSGELFYTLSQNVDIYIRQTVSWIINNFVSLLSKGSILILNLFVFFISLYYIIKDGLNIKTLIYKISPLDEKDNIFIFQNLKLAVESMVKGTLLVTIIQGVLVYIGFTFFGIPNSILWGTVTLFAALIPGLGTAIVTVPGIVYLANNGNMYEAIGLAIWGLVVVGLVDNILRPKLVGKEMGLHPLLVLISVLGGISFFGAVGVFLGPLILSLLSAFSSIYIYLLNKYITL